LQEAAIYFILFYCQHPHNTAGYFIATFILLCYVCNLLKSRQMMPPNRRFGGIGSKLNYLSSGRPKSTSFRETTLFDVLSVKIGAGVLAVELSEPRKSSRVTFVGYIAQMSGKTP